MIDNTYNVIKSDLVELLNNVDEFETLIERFKQKHPQYNYSIDVKNIDEGDGHKWMASINIRTKDAKETSTT